MGAISRSVRLFVQHPNGFFEILRRHVRPRKKAYRQRLRMSLSRWLIYHQKEIVFEKCRWMGVKALKNPLDAWIYQEIIYEVKPDVIVELGSAEGGSTLYLAGLLELMGHGTVVSVDHDRSRYSVKHDRIITVTGLTSSEQTIAQVAAICEGRSVLVIHDADHHRNQVFKDLEAYAPLVSVGSYFIVEDGVMDLFRPGDGLGGHEDGPLGAVEEFVKRNADFVVDSERERYILTYNPQGFLKRMR